MGELMLIFLIFGGQTIVSLVGLIKAPSGSILNGLLSFAAAMMLGIPLFQLIPESLEIVSLSLILIYSFIGIIMLIILRYFLMCINPYLFEEKFSTQRSIIMFVVAIALHNIPEGWAMGTGFALNSKLGLAIAISIVAHDIPENITTIVSLYALTMKRLKSFIVLGVTVLFELFGFLLGYYVLRDAPKELLGISLAFVAGFMIYISIRELMPTALASKRHFKIGAICFLGGILVTMLVTFL